MSISITFNVDEATAEKLEKIAAAMRQRLGIKDSSIDKTDVTTAMVRLNVDDWVRRHLGDKD